MKTIIKNGTRSEALLKAFIYMAIGHMLVSIFGISNYSEEKQSIVLLSIFVFMIVLYIIYRNRLEKVYRILFLIGLLFMFVIMAAFDLQIVIVHYNPQLWINIKHACFGILLLILLAIVIIGQIFNYRYIKYIKK